MADDPMDRVERELTVLARRLERVRMASGAGDPAVIADRSAYLLLGRLHDGGPARLSALSAAFGLDVSTVSRQIAVLTGADLVERTPDPTDGRACLLRITAAGTSRLLATRAARRSVVRDLLASWPAADRETFGRLLERYNAGAAARFDAVDAAGAPLAATTGGRG